MPLRGKILNTWEVDPGELLASAEVHNIAIALGVDPGSTDLDGLRYHKICILADADSDGQHIATLSAKGRLVVDLTIERGKGYASSDRDTRKVIGVIPIDAIFSPVRRCTFTVEPTRVEQSTNYDRLVLDIETDGSIEPREALSSAGATLRALVDLVASLSDDGMSKAANLSDDSLIAGTTGENDSADIMFPLPGGIEYSSGIGVMD